MGMVWNSTFISTAPPEPSKYRKSSQVPISSQDGIRENQTFNGDFSQHRATNKGNISLNRDLKSTNFEPFNANRSNLNASFHLADTLAQRKIDSIVQKFERRHQSLTTSTTTLTSTTSPLSTNNQSLLIPATVAATGDNSVTSQRKFSPLSQGASSDRVPSSSATTKKRSNNVRDESVEKDDEKNGHSGKEVSQTFVPLTDFQKEVEKLSTLMEEFSLRIQRQNDLDQRHKDKRKEITQNTEKKREEFLGKVQSNIELSIKAKNRSDECSQLANHVATLSKAIEESRYSISRLRPADSHLHEMKWVHYKLKKTLDKQKRIISDMDAENATEMKKPIHSGSDSGLRARRDNLSKLSANLYKLQQENQSLKNQLKGIKTMTPTKHQSDSSNFSNHFKPIPRRTSVLSAHSSRPSSRRQSAVSTISSSTMTFK